jgi:hypothetical protein
MIKRDGSPLTTSVTAIRDSINNGLKATLIQRVECNPANHLMFSTMDTVKATSVNSKISQFLHLIPGITTVHLDSPTRLTHLAENHHLLDSLQIGGRPRRSGVDAAMFLATKIDQANKKHLITSTFGIDVKVAFDNVYKPRLLLFVFFLFYSYCIQS